MHMCVYVYVHMHMHMHIYIEDRQEYSIILLAYGSDRYINYAKRVPA
jgi:hypothetical protein